ncbi:hypothetical protein BpHYR1_010094 [Brachionus plicatilis]|uniref:Uncharacterized protein n=1 Tax=Brachionus plicatilis TaxID=10195 RepID=A0A3M7QRX2_BRAPC|nr:hypothetical protein BpHYR1_010094 [Brachionus plicatilis]
MSIQTRDLKESQCIVFVYATFIIIIIKNLAFQHFKRFLKQQNLSLILISILLKLYKNARSSSLSHLEALRDRNEKISWLFEI